MKDVINLVWRKQYQNYKTLRAYSRQELLVSCTDVNCDFCNVSKNKVKKLLPILSSSLPGTLRGVGRIFERGVTLACQYYGVGVEVVYSSSQGQAISS